MVTGVEATGHTFEDTMRALFDKGFRDLFKPWAQALLNFFKEFSKQ